MTVLVLFAYILMLVLLLAGLTLFFVGINDDVKWMLPLSLLLFTIAIIIDVTFGDTMLAVI